MTDGMLDGITVLDLASVGPAAHASRWLSDYGARVVKVGPVPNQQGVQIVPPYFSYSAHRGMQRALFDLKAPEGREAFLRLADTADVIIESFRPGVVAKLGVGYEAVSARNPRAIYCSTTGFGQRRPALAVGRPRPQLSRHRRLPRLHRTGSRRRPTDSRRDGRRQRRAVACTR